MKRLLLESMEVILPRLNKVIVDENSSNPVDLGLIRPINYVALVTAGLISVIVTTYNREDALAAVLRSLARRASGSQWAVPAHPPAPISTA